MHTALLPQTKKPGRFGLASTLVEYYEAEIAKRLIAIVMPLRAI